MKFLRSHLQYTTIFAALLLSGCLARNYSPAQYLELYSVPPPSLEAVPVCHSIGCEEITTMQLSEKEWQVLNDLFVPVAPDAVIERQRISKAIGFWEEIAGEKAGTGGDRGRNKMGIRGSQQLDCRAESVNSTIFLLVLQEKDFFSWHKVANPAYRGLLKGLEPHNTAVIIDEVTGEEFVVDSWFFDNGTPAVIVTLESWLAGYDPQKAQEKLEKVE